MNDNYEYITAESAYNVPDVAMGIFSVMIEQGMNSLWYIDAEERKAMIHECFLWAEDFCSECGKYEEKEEEDDE